MNDRTARRRSLGFCLLFCLGIGALIAFSVHYSYQHAQEYAQRSLRHSSDLIAEWIIGAFAASDYVLRDIAGHVDPAELLYPHPDPHRQQRLTELLLDKKATVPHAFLVGAFDAECRVTHTNAHVGFDASEREYCQALRDHPTRHTFVSLGYVSNTGQFNVTQARRLPHASDAFIGMVAIGVDLEFFARWLAKIDIPPQASIAIIDHNALVLARKPFYEEVLRDMDIFGRWGGDEFVVLLPDGYATAQAVAERVRHAVQQAKVADDQGQPFGLRTTIGFASTEAHATTVPTLDQLFSHADQALYAAKQAGRNRVYGGQV